MNQIENVCNLKIVILLRYRFNALEKFNRGTNCKMEGTGFDIANRKIQKMGNTMINIYPCDVSVQMVIFSDEVLFLD